MFQVYSTDMIEDEKGKEIQSELVEICRLSHTVAETESFPYAWGSLDNTFIIKNFPEGKGLKVLDLGAGAAVLQIYLATKGHKVVAVDRRNITEWIHIQNLKFGIKIKPFSCDFAEDISNEATKKFIDTYTNYFDVVVSNSALEHNPHKGLQRILSNVKSVLKDGGRFVATITIAGKSVVLETGKPADPLIHVKDPEDLLRSYNIDGFSFYSNKNNFEDLEKHRDNMRKFSEYLNFRWAKYFCMCGIVLIRKVKDETDFKTS